MMTSSNGNIFHATGPSCWEFTGHRWNSPHKGQWRGALMLSLICAWTNGWVNNWLLMATNKLYLSIRANLESYYTATKFDRHWGNLIDIERRGFLNTRWGTICVNSWASLSTLHTQSAGFISLNSMGYISWVCNIRYLSDRFASSGVVTVCVRILLRYP